MKPHLRITVETLLARGVSPREVARRTGVDRKTIRGHARALANSPSAATGSPAAEGQTPPPRPPALSEESDAGTAPLAASPATPNPVCLRAAPRLD